jgi:hypothetical protein
MWISFALQPQVMASGAVQHVHPKLTHYRAMPTFELFVNGTKREEFKGANKAQLERIVRQYAPTTGNKLGE